MAAVGRPASSQKERHERNLLETSRALDLTEQR
jgi:hypothetical protein